MPTDALDFHRAYPAGKLAVVPTKLVETLADLNLAYTPGVAEPCTLISKNKERAYDFTAKGNLVGVITNGTAVLGLGDIGAEAAKPVMEGKVVLLKQLAGIDAFDLEIAEKDPARLVEIVKALAPTFGGINLEDIKAPGCFAVEKALQAALPMPVMHDDQHSTAIVVGAALKNALLLVKKELADLQVVIYGAGAGALASASLLCSMGVQKENMVLFDSQGIIRVNRPHLPPHKAIFATERLLSTLEEALTEADFFLGLSVGDVLKPAHLRVMAPSPIVFALANPTPEIAYDLALATRDDIIMATGRSDYPNQVNNVLAFPYIFRGLLDVRASQLNEAIKLAAVEAIAEVVHQQESIIYSQQAPPPFSKYYLLPSALDPRLLMAVAPAVAKVAIESGIAKKPVLDWKAYKDALQARVTSKNCLHSDICTDHKKSAKTSPHRI